MIEKIYIAIRDGELEIVDKILKANPSLLHARHIGPTPLHFAAAGGHLEALKLLIKAGANVNLIDSGIATPTFRAAASNQAAVLKELIKAGANLNITGQFEQTPAFTAAEGGNIEALDVLIEAGADLDIANESGDTAVHAAVRFKQVSVLQKLVAAKADLFRENNSGETPIYMAAKFGNVDCLQVLIDAGVDINQANEFGDRPIFAAIDRIYGIFGNKNCYNMLLANGARLLGNTTLIPLLADPEEDDEENREILDRLENPLLAEKYLQEAFDLMAKKIVTRREFDKDQYKIIRLLKNSVALSPEIFLAFLQNVWDRKIKNFFFRAQHLDTIKEFLEEKILQQSHIDLANSILANFYYHYGFSPVTGNLIHTTTLDLPDVLDPERLKIESQNGNPDLRLVYLKQAVKLNFNEYSTEYHLSIRSACEDKNPACINDVDLNEVRSAEILYLQKNWLPKIMEALKNIPNQVDDLLKEERKLNSKDTLLVEDYSGIFVSIKALRHNLMAHLSNSQEVLGKDSTNVSEIAKYVGTTLDLIRAIRNNLGENIADLDSNKILCKTETTLRHTLALEPLFEDLTEVPRPTCDRVGLV